MKWLLGRAPYGTLENMRREEYNSLLRRTYLGREPVFDLATIESTAPDGTVMDVEWEGKHAPLLVSAFTHDGSHLNAEGRRRAAREFIRVLASVPVHTGGLRPSR